jgi:serine O-acetyltransferase
MRESEHRLHDLVGRLESQDLPGFMQLPSVNPRPSREAVHAIAKGLQSLLFPGYFESAALPPRSRAQSSREGLRYRLGDTLERARRELVEQVMRALCFRCAEPGRLECGKAEAQDKVARFLDCLPGIRQALAADAQAAYRGDPAAGSPEEIIFCYPGMTAIIYHRLAHELHRLGVPLIARMIAEKAHSLTGIDIHPAASIGEGLFIDHGTGVVIGETAVIGRNVRIYQGVTLGARSFPVDADGNLIKGAPRHPVLEDDVIIYSGATVLGRITVGRGSMIGGNVWLTDSVPPGSKISQRKPRQDGFEEGAGI